MTKPNLAIAVAGCLATLLAPSLGYGQAKDSLSAWSIPSKWKECKASAECVSIYICGSEAINKKFEKDFRARRSQVACAASPPPIEHVICKNNSCQLSGPASSVQEAPI